MREQPWHRVRGRMTDWSKSGKLSVLPATEFISTPQNDIAGTLLHLIDIEADTF